ncbi:glutathione S-transferase family protein [Chondromyces apiculatus]|uniref:Glutathione S-transferase n=1 Tax=Chondromyces apiculatus DSM 436 TaxID=1192034 RepID=A0A017T792_9BACT|nr:glutathione S-transferase N-terminal domain-containing protein [Chondromyces apiculatus]EYF05079.1 Glutathione S-transferase [Chondromyces apiculatus DSM 436]
MITLYTFTTPNGRKVSIMLEELGLPYEVKTVDISKGEQFDPAFLAISPNNKIPALVDDEAEGGRIALFESGAILTYLAEKTGKLLAPSGPARYEAIAWLHWQIGGLGPMFGQLGFFGVFSKEKIPTAIKRYADEANRLLGVMEKRLTDSAYLAGDEYSIADIATYPWAVNSRTFLGEFLAESVAQKPAVQRWLDAVGARPAVQRGMAVPKV